MIQRIQSIYLFLAAAASGGMFALPYAETPQAVDTSYLFADGVFTIDDRLPVMVTFVIAGLASLIAVFLYKNRVAQMRVSILAMIASVIGIGLGLAFFFQDNADEMADPAVGVALPLLMVLFAYLAWRNIRKDEKLVRSMDRLR